MSEKLLDLLKIFLEKYLVPTVIAIVFSFIAYYVTPTDNKLLVKFTIWGYAVFLFCVWFLIIELVIWLVQKIQYHNYSKGVEQRNKQRQAEEWQQSLEFLWTDVDNLSSSDYKLLLRFIKNENQPYCSSGTPMGHCLLNSDWVHKTVSKPAKRVLIKSNQRTSSKAIPIPVYETISETYQYILREDIYQMLKYSYEKYGKISHFK
ncbi:TPA: hypothetical protein P1M42_000229 [Clostridioides difficile]|uniref:Uncharacterized protein n=1 Tax=Clostridioides difficile ATCC 9689 = DSM 1296 TaxID=1121308 RepID=A0AC59G3Q0_CLODI|nr:hypothetical protein [Clostridioides difficile]EQE66897.1 hypothetical protein QCO_3472 [Clostridioides difficile CD47]EQG39906.1 hypothetical protein QIM_0412 [Clostridioides difficile DA00128]EQG88339.1 hypothetical protein QKC_0420 [Clostridioides difficile DA00167]EQH33018.1 hypothetical protein QM9_3537 [Clostridioides difficile DA00238]EQH58313.1 hypothetical protein QMK_3523 [Clostridioides difficile DA00273]EQH74090.1 hypothetical protein QMS_3572 [Clostridioides difficile DA00307]